MEIKEHAYKFQNYYKKHIKILYMFNFKLFFYLNFVGVDVN